MRIMSFFSLWSHALYQVDVFRHILKIAKSAVFGGQQCFEKYKNMGQQAELRWSNKLMPLGIGSWLLLFIHCTILLLHVPLNFFFFWLWGFFFFKFQLQTHDPSIRACVCWLISVCDFYFYLLSKSIINKHVLCAV